jgi:hypothetical protein
MVKQPSQLDNTQNYPALTAFPAHPARLRRVAKVQQRAETREPIEL